MSAHNTQRALFFLSGVCVIAFASTTAVGAHHFAGWFLMSFFFLIAVAIRSYELLKGYSFTVMIFAAVSLAMYYPQYFISVGDFKLSRLIVPLMQVIMFGMGTGLSLKDFARVVRMPKGVIAGVMCHYLIMP